MSIGLQGAALPLPVALYPRTINNLPTSTGTNYVSLPPGGDLVIPSGKFIIYPGQYSVIQVQDPVTTVWLPVETVGSNRPSLIDSDGQNFRVYNPLGFPYGAVVNNGGTGYTSAPAVTGNAGSTWVAVVGGALSAININSGGSGANYSVPPIVSIDFPPSPGVPATAICAISGGSISSFTIINPGAGYKTAPTVTLVPQQSDANVQSGSTAQITNAKATAQLSYVGVVTAVLLTNEGNNPLTAAPALTFSGGGGSGLTATALMALTVTGYTVTTAGSGYVAPVAIVTSGGLVTSAASASNSPSISTGLLVPRQTIIQGVVSGSGVSTNGAAGGGIIDGGIFNQAPASYVIPGATLIAAGQGQTSAAPVSAVISLTMGSVNDTVYVQPVP